MTKPRYCEDCGKELEDDEEFYCEDCTYQSEADDDYDEEFED